MNAQEAARQAIQRITADPARLVEYYSATYPAITGAEAQQLATLFIACGTTSATVKSL